MEGEGKSKSDGHDGHHGDVDPCVGDQTGLGSVLWERGGLLTVVRKLVCLYICVHVFT